MSIMEKKNKYTDKQIEQALTYVEIFSKEEEIDCGGCGYATCREFASAMLDGKARPSQCVVLSKKIIEKLKKKEKELRESLFLNQEILDAVPAPILYEDIDGKAIGCNRAYEEVSGVKRIDIKGKKLEEYSNNKDYDALNETVNASLLKTRTSRIVETVIKDPEGRILNIELHKGIFTDRSGEPAGFVSVIFDITSRIETRKQIETARNTAELSVSLLKKNPTAFVITDGDLKIVDCNQAFAELMGSEINELYGTSGGLKGADLRTMFESCELFSSVMQNEDGTFSKDVLNNGKKLKITLFSIDKNKAAGAILSDLTLPSVRNSEVKERAAQVIKENLETVQKIAYLLGENASKTENVLSSVIKLFSEDE